MSRAGGRGTDGGGSAGAARPAGEGGGASGAALVARFLRQQEELGGTLLHLDDVPATTLARWARQARTQGGIVRGPTGGPGDDAPPSPSVAPPSMGASPPTMASPPAASQNAGTGTSTGVADGAQTLDELRATCLGCTRCGLSETRQEVVFADGNPGARVMVVGEAPGANEDTTGVPFVGAAGKLLDLLLQSVDLSRKDSVYICNVIKCRPPGNRNPTTAEIATCSPFLLRQIELVAPEVILAVGTFAGKLLTGEDSTLGALRGRVHRYHDTPLVVTYHPAALLRNPGWTRATWDDLQLLRRVLAGEEETS